MTTPAVVVFSGGQDSTTVLGLARSFHAEIHTLAFRYGQRHEVELAQAEAIAERWGVTSHRQLDVASLSDLGDSALVAGSTADIGADHAREGHLPASFVPGRNAVFLTLGHALAQRVGATALYTGVCQTDYSGYPDCRRVFVQALEAALNIGYGKEVRIHTPLMHLDKAQTFAVAAEGRFLRDVVELSHTCYEGDRTTLHDWGYGCGKCPACTLRRAGYEKYQTMPMQDVSKAYNEALASYYRA